MYLVCIAGTIAFWFLGEGGWSWWECLYMVVITITTVGYGEVIPVSQSTEGLIVTMVVMIGGPLWFKILDLVGAYFPMAWLGHKLAGGNDSAG